MSNANQINPEVARLLQILSSTTGTSLTALHPQPQPQPQPHQPQPQPQPQSQPPASASASIALQQPLWPLQQSNVQPTADPRLAAYSKSGGTGVSQVPPYSSTSTSSSQLQNQHGPSSSYPQPAQALHSYPLHAPQQQPPPKTDPSTITQWPAALRYVTTVIVRDDLVMAKLRKMKKNQKDNEIAWHLSRQELIKKQKARVEGNKQVDELLKHFSPSPLPSPSTTSHPTTPTSSTETEESELHTFDLKVHKAATSMVNAMSAELGQLGIPFFCGGKGGTPILKEELEGEDSDSGSKFGIEEGELRELRRRMMELVGDLVGE